MEGIAFALGAAAGAFLLIVATVIHDRHVRARRRRAEKFFAESRLREWMLDDD